MKTARRQKDAVGTAAAGERLVDLAEALRLLKTSRPTFYRWLRSGRIKGMKVGRQWRFYAADIERFLKGETPRMVSTAGLDPLLATLQAKLQALGVGPSAPGPDKVAVAVNQMLLLGVKMRASDIHLTANAATDAGEKGVLRYRVDGALHVIAEFDLRLLPALVQEWKRLAACNQHETNQPQDGRIMINVTGKNLDLRAAFLPAVLGESVTVRILDQAAVCLKLDALPYSAGDQARIRQALHAPWGLILCTGPTGCGKTTTLYAGLGELASPGLKVLSVEDPVEYILPWVTQVAIRPAVGRTFATTLRAFLRADPDVVMIGEIRDRETLEVAFQVALTGHLVLTTLHTDDAAAALRRMTDIGAEPFLVGDAVKLVIAQRLVRKLCQHCRTPDKPDTKMLARLKAAAVQGGLDWDHQPRTFMKAVGCAQCATTGYRGRTLIAETLAVTAAVGRAIRANAAVDEIRAVAVQEGMTTMAADAIRRAAAGETALQEIAFLL